MFSPEFKTLIIKVISSWQVIGVTVVMILFVFLINFVGNLNRRRGSGGIPEPMPGGGDSATEMPADDDLGLEEKKP